MNNSNQPAYLVTLPPPTPNGGLHLGHLAGPFLAADVFAKAKKASGCDVHVLSFSDTNQSYVRATAEKQGVDPIKLACDWSADILKTLDAYGCTVDHYFEPDTTTNGYCRDLFLSLYEEGILVKKAYPFFYSTMRKEFLDEAGVGGLCPRCLDNCKCGICEHCGQINDATTLVLPYDSNSPDLELVIRYVDVLVLELEKWRDQLTEFHETNNFVRPKYQWLVRESLSEKLPDFPISVPGCWGISLEHQDFPGQYLNAWPEILTNFMYGYEKFEEKQIGDHFRVVNFFGFDNSYFYALVHVALLYAFKKEKYLPYSTMTNEFYSLDHDKFSTSRNHVIWAGDAIDTVLPDVVRLYCSVTTPGYEKSNFLESDMHRVVENRFSSPWDLLARRLNEYITISRYSPSEQPESYSDTANAIISAIKQHASKYYDIEKFSLRLSSDAILSILPAINSYLTSPCTTASPGQAVNDTLGMLTAFAHTISPIAPELAMRIHKIVEIVPCGGFASDARTLLRYQSVVDENNSRFELV